jgi:hypothetical protein
MRCSKKGPLQRIHKMKAAALFVLLLYIILLLVCLYVANSKTGFKSDLKKNIALNAGIY